EECDASSCRASDASRFHPSREREPDLPLEHKEALYRIAHEALHNAAKHAHANAIRLHLNESPDAVVLEVIDDGDGFDPRAAYPGHLGLTSMRERAELMRAELSVHSARQHGTHVVVRVPLSR